MKALPRSLTALLFCWLGLAGISMGSDLVDPLTPPGILPLGQPESARPTGWKLTFSDEFRGPELDGTRWTRPGWRWPKDLGPGIENWNRKDNVWVDGTYNTDGGVGALIFQIRKESDTLYSGGEVDSGGRFEQKHGYWEMRFFAPDNPVGENRAFYLMTRGMQDEGTWEGTAKDAAEIDIFELPYKSPTLQSSIHWDGYGAKHKKTNQKPDVKTLYDGKWHTVGMWWDESGYSFYYDGKSIGSITDPASVCEVPAYIKAGAGATKWEKNSNIWDAKLPRFFYVDYIRVWTAHDPAISPIHKP